MARNDEIEILKHNESVSNASMGNQLMAKIQDLHIKQEFIASNYDIIRNMVQTIYEYKATINSVNALEQSIFVLEAKAVILQCYMQKVRNKMI